MTRLTTRSVPWRAQQQLLARGVPDLLANLFAARGVRSADELDYALGALLAPAQLRQADAAAELLADTIAARRRILIVADYDCDGATACAVGIRGLRALGASVDFLVPNRFEHGYGLTPEIVRIAAQRKPDLLVTVDNGIASVAGVAEARTLGMQTLVTDHHLPGDALPEATAIVNPNQPGCSFASKSLAGVGVMFYVLVQLRATLRARGVFAATREPNFSALLDLVALGTVADVVRLDHNNRVLVSQGLRRMREGKACAGIQALFRIAGRDITKASAWDLGFGIGPRVNAAGRLGDMSLGIECLVTDDIGHAMAIAQQLDGLNRERQVIAADMQDQALAVLDRLDTAGTASVALFDPGWHQGVVGILASRIRDAAHRPAIAFARGDNGEIKGSGRSIPGLHLRDALDLLSKQAPGLLLRFGGHATAAGLTLLERDLETFRALFEATVDGLLDPAQRTRTLETDGSLAEGHASLLGARMLDDQVWGQGFPAPVFLDEFVVERQRVLKERHLKLLLRRGRARFDAIWFNAPASAPERVRAAYRLDINSWQGVENVQLVIEHLEAA